MFSPDVTLGQKNAIELSPFQRADLCLGLFRCEARPTMEKDPLKSLKRPALPKPVLAGGRAARLSHDW